MTEQPPRRPDLVPRGFEGEQIELLSNEKANTRHLSARSKERIRAIDVLYEADARDLPVLDVLQQRRLRTAAQTPLPERSGHLVEVFARNTAEIDEQLSTHSRDWPLHRMPAVDRAVLRLGAAEVLFDVPAEEGAAVIGEYATIARELSTEDSPRFVNGVLQSLADLRGLLG